MAQSGGVHRAEDAELLAAIAARREAAFGVFYRRHLPRVLAYLMRETADREASADLAAETFAAVMLASRSYRRQGDSAAPWVIGIARNLLGSSRRRGRVEDRARRRLGYEPVLLEDPDLERVATLADAGSSGLETMLAALPAAERDALVAHVVDERGYAEIAAALSCSPMVIRKRVSRGLARLRAGLGERR
ncbi:MAG: RNA polymerase sigma factor [Actinomycetota bacterium]|nr:RNA polymerase sigma factor [Actinomycetota bacterium]